MGLSPFQSKQRLLLISGNLFLSAFILTSSSASAQTTYYARVGAETPDQSVQANGFFPNELWLLEGDSIQWRFVPKNEIHTLTLLAQPPGAAEQVRPAPPPPAGPPFFVQGVNCPAAPASFDGSACLSTQTGLTAPANFTVTFPTAGNYKFVCLVHTDMNGTVHVLKNNAANQALIQSQNFYDYRADQTANAVLNETNSNQSLPQPLNSKNMVAAGIGKIASTGGGLVYGAAVRFINGKIVIHAGESVTWVNLDPTEPHTVTFGAEPAHFIPPIPAGLGAPLGDGTLTASAACSPAPAKACDADYGQITDPAVAYNSTIFLNSGFLVAQSPDRTGTPQLPPGTTRFTVTFSKPGSYFYHCALHDVDGMYGEVLVVP